MSDQRFSASPATRTEIPRPKRGEGQWALGYTEPLNKNEQSKKDDDPLHVRDRILHIYSKRGFASIDPADLRGRFRWMGLYTQRAPGFDGGKTAMLEEEELDDEYFMLRVRSDGRLLLARDRPGARHASASTSRRDTADVTDRENIQFHWIRIEDVPEIWQRLDDAGLSSTEACGDSPRPVPRLPRRRRRRRRDHRRHRARCDEIKRRAHRQPGVLEPAAQVQDRAHRPPQPRRLARDQRRRRSSAPSTPSTAPASTSGSAAGCRPTRCSPRSWASGSRSTRSPTSGRAWPRSSATTATAGCARGPG